MIFLLCYIAESRSCAGPTQKLGTH